MGEDARLRTGEGRPRELIGVREAERGGGGGGGLEEVKRMHSSNLSDAMSVKKNVKRCSGKRL